MRNILQIQIIRVIYNMENVRCRNTMFLIEDMKLAKLNKQKDNNFKLKEMSKGEF